MRKILFVALLCVPNVADASGCPGCRVATVFSAPVAVYQPPAVLAAPVYVPPPVILAAPACYSAPAAFYAPAQYYPPPQAAFFNTYSAPAFQVRSFRSFERNVYAAPAVFAAPAVNVNLNVVERRGLFGGLFAPRSVTRTRSVSR